MSTAAWLPRGQGPASLQATDLVHEAVLRLARERKGWADRPNFMVAATVAMRRVLVDRARRRRAVGREALEADPVAADSLWIHDRTLDLLAVEQELVQMESHNPDAAQVAELRLFGGLDNSECAAALDCSVRTIERRWRFARAWLLAALGNEKEGRHG